MLDKYLFNSMFSEGLVFFGGKDRKALLYIMDTAQMSLTSMVENARERVAAHKEVLSPDDLASRVHALIAEELAENAEKNIVDREGNVAFTFPFYACVSRPGVVCVGELVREEQPKAEGDDEAHEEIEFVCLEPAIACAAAGVAALSYVSEPSAFGGSDAEFLEIADTVSVPVLQKDIIVDEYQVDLAYAQGAQAITLVAGALSQEELANFSARAHSLGMDVVVAVQSQEDIQKALGAHATILSLNDILLSEQPLNKDEITALRETIPPQVLVLTTGVTAIDDVAHLVELDAKGAFVGDMLTKAEDRKLVVQAFDEVVNEAMGAAMGGNAPIVPGPLPGSMPGSPDAPMAGPGAVAGPGGPAMSAHKDWWVPAGVKDYMTPAMIPALAACDVTGSSDLSSVNASAVTYVEFNFEKGAESAVSPEEAKALRAGLNPEIVTLGSFTDADIASVTSLIEEGVISGAVLCGEEDAAYIESLRQAIPEALVWKVYKTLDPSTSAQSLYSEADLVLFNAEEVQDFNAQLLSSYPRPYGMRGALNAQQVANLLQITSPVMVDCVVNSDAQSKNLEALYAACLQSR